MADQNTLVYFTVLHVLLNICLHTCQGKIFSRESQRHKQTVIVDLNDYNLNQVFDRKRRDVSDVGSVPTESNVKNNSLLSSSVFRIPDKLHSQAVVHWSGENGKVVFVLTRQTEHGFVTDSTLWRSSDYGTTFQRIDLPSDAVAEFIYSSPVKRNQLILTDILNKKVHYTNDEGITWTSSYVAFEPDKLLLHPTENQWLLGYSVISMELFSSGDFGKTWTLLHEAVSHRFYWAVENVDQNNLTVHMEIQDLHMLGPSEYLACVAPDCQDVTPDKDIGEIDPFSMIVRNEYVFVQKSTLRSSDMFVSHNRGPFRKAYFPMNLHPTDFHIVDTSEHQVFIAADHKEMEVNLYLSDTNGQFYVPTLRNVVSTIEDPWLDVDLYEVKGVQGTYITNQYVNLSNGKVVEKTFISFDKGGSWSLVAVPEDLKLSCEDQLNCHLHLHMRYSNLIFGIPDIVSDNAAPGLIIAHGYIGEKVTEDAHVFISRDGGFSWNKTPFDGLYKINILDQGGAIIAIEQNRTKVTNVVHFSSDDGATWQLHQFSTEMMYVDGVLTEPGISTLIVSVFGRLSDKSGRQMVKLNFSSILTNICEDDDYISWIPVNKANNRNCILGETIEYQRRKPNAICYYGPEFKRLKPKSLCQCTAYDYECDYGYEPEDINRHICQRADWFDDSRINHHCVEGDFYIRSQGYRKIASNKCVGGVEKSGKYELLNISCPVYKPEGLSLSIEHDTVATGSSIVFKLSQVKGSTHSTIYTWDFGDSKPPLIDLGFDKTKTRTHKYTKAGKYQVTVVAKNSVGVATCTRLIKVEDEITDLNIQIPRGAEINHPTMVIVNVLSKTNSSNFGLIHYVWNFGDQFKPNGTKSLLTWNNAMSHNYTSVSKYNLTVEAVNSVSSVVQHFMLQVHKNLTTLRLMFSSNIDHFNTQSLLWRISFANIVCMNLAEILYVDRSRLNVFIPNQKPTMADVTILPPYLAGITIDQIVFELQDKLQTGQLSFKWMPNEDPITVTKIEVLTDDDNRLPKIPETTTSINVQPHENSRQTSPILIAVPLIIVVFVLAVIVGCFIKRFKRKSKTGQQYSLILNRNQLDTSCAESDEDLTVEDYDIHDGDTNIVINPDFQPSLEFMSLGTTNSNDLVSC
ncbi:VPS10 domain-containing receptor SorCS3-like [Mytilus trossulus]